MDPNETLRRLREAVDDADTQLNTGVTNPVRPLEEFVEFFQALDEWMSNGGFLPRDWSSQKKGGQ